MDVPLAIILHLVYRPLELMLSRTDPCLSKAYSRFSRPEQGLLSVDRASALQLSTVPTIPNRLLTLKCPLLFALPLYSCSPYDREGLFLSIHVFSNINER